MEKDPVLEKYKNEGFGKNAFGWYFNPWKDEYDPDYDPHNDKEYNEALDEKEIKWHPKLTPEQIEELIAENIYPWDKEYNLYLWNHGIKAHEKVEEHVEVETKETEKEDEKSIKEKSVKQQSDTKIIDSEKHNKRNRVETEEQKQFISPPIEMEDTKGIFARIFDKIKSVIQSHRKKISHQKESNKPSLIQRLIKKNNKLEENVTTSKSFEIDRHSEFADKHKVNAVEQVIEKDEIVNLDEEAYRKAYDERQKNIQENNKGESR